MKIRLNIALLVMGWGTIIAFMGMSICQVLMQRGYAIQAGFDTENLGALTLAHAIGALVTSPFHLPVGLLCLFAATYLEKSEKTMSEIFE